jgi:hypothetical protein
MDDRRIERLYDVLAMLEAMEEEESVAALRWAIFNLERMLEHEA